MRQLSRSTDADRVAGQCRLDDEIRAFHLAEVRRNRSLTQREAADAMGVSGPHVSDVERGNLDTISESTTLPTWSRDREAGCSSAFGSGAFTLW
jgi:predicted XRE-type DNA-binding protein